ncbi:hypothetical protein [Duganella qianjiadongensis]|uniref:Periplasmic heavy metal sensor n=1 Tax=Duganella qianjiadongensis TaxID=2692176 RepID=A0ABW9VMP1_9BURK|nr:hypothetical protein [Duganella qianjiadongensis]MYM40713.1 hypothetical protein [Duganella qianjiadongensis]
MQARLMTGWRRSVAALALGAALAPAWALPAMEMRAEDYLPMAAELKKALNLNSNQQILWQQTETKTRNLLRERQTRREQMQAALQEGLKGSNVELRELAKAVETEAAAAASEEKLLREWWLTVNDALSESQRQTVVQLVAEQLQRVPERAGPAAGGARREEGGEGRHGGGRRGGGGASINGPGGSSLNLPMPGGGG